MQGKLESHFFSFVRQLGDAELIDELDLTGIPQDSKRADAFFDNRLVIGEVKLLRIDTAPKITRILEPLQKTNDWPVFFGERPISQILEHLPQRERLTREIYDAVAGSLEYLVRDANRQVRETKKSFDLPTARGLLVVLNDTIDILDPNVMAHKFGQALLKKDAQGAARFPHIGCVWALCETHTTAVEGTKALLSVVIANPRISLDAELNKFMDSLQQRWAEFNRMPMYRTTMPIQDMNRMDLRPVKTAPESSQVTAAELWRREYRAKPFLRSLSREELLDFGNDVMDRAARLLGKNSPTSIPQTMELMGRETTAFFEEIEFRNMDMRELARRRRDKDLQGSSGENAK